jgi:DNA-binding CsgD family transcriptional regulator
MARLMLGQLDAAEAAGVESLSAATAMGDAMYTVVVLVTLARVAALRGDAAAARRWAEQGADRAAASGNVLLGALAAVGIGMAAWASGDAAAAVESLEYSLPAVAIVNSASAVEIAGVLADARRAAGRAGPDDVADLAIAVGGPWGRARACIADSRATENPVAAHEALEIAATLDDRVTQVDALELLASHESRRGAHRRAVELVAAAAAERNRLGYRAVPLADLPGGDVEAAATAALGEDEVAVARSSGAALALAFAVAKARANHGRRGRPVSGWASLTPAERRVSELVAEGLTNPQIAERLVVSRETVKGHVSSALRKLGARNRAELGVLATRHGAA